MTIGLMPPAQLLLPPSTLDPVQVPTQAAADPYLKWAGGKRALVPALIPPVRYYLAGTRHRFVEPFAGSAALSLALGGPLVLGDVSGALVEVHRAIRDEPGHVLQELDSFGQLIDGVDEATYDQVFYQVRDAWNADAYEGSAKRAAAMLFLNRTCYNGLWRQNRRGEFNAPVGKPRRGKANLPGREQILQASAALADARIEHADFRMLLDQVGPGDVVCVDPPYFGTYDGYSGEAWTETDREELAARLAKLAARGVVVLAFDADAPETRALYSWAEITPLAEREQIAGKVGSRGVRQALLAVTPGWDLATGQFTELGAKPLPPPRSGLRTRPGSTY